MVIKALESGDTFYQNNRVLTSPTRGKTKPIKNSAQSPLSGRGKRIEFSEVPDRVRSGNIAIPSVRGSPQGKNRVTPSKDRSPRCSPSHVNYYAGFGDSPAPAALPKPPPHWMAPFQFSPPKVYSFLKDAQCQSLSCGFRDIQTLLKVQA